MAALPLPAMAAPAAAQVKGDWAVTMMQGEKKSFAYCLARAPYNNGLQLAIALSPKKEVNVGVAVPDAGYTLGDKYPMTVSIDGTIKRSHAGIAAQPQLLMVPLGPDKEMFAAIKTGKVLSVEGPEDVASFSLTGAGKALERLQQCVDVGTGKIKPSAAAAAAAPAMASAPPQAAANTEADAASAPPAKFPPSLLHLLKSAGLKNLTLVEIKDPSKAPVDFAWKTGGVLGGLRERPVPPEITLEKMSDIIGDGYKKQCTGKFAAKLGGIEELPGLRLRKADFGCDMGAQSAHVALLLYITDTHLFSMFMHEAHANEKAKAISARDAISAQIHALAKEQGPALKKAGAPAASSAPVEAPAAAPAASPIMAQPSSSSPSAWADPNKSSAAPAASAPVAPATTTTTTTTTSTAAKTPPASPAPSATPQPLPSAPPPAASSTDKK